MLIKRSLVVIAALTFAVASFAQGGGGQGRGMMRGGGGMYGLLQRDDVKEELKLTDEQKTKLGEMQQGMMDEMRSAFQDAAGDRSAMQKIMAKVQESAAKKVNAILTPDQQKRLKEINIQESGNSALMSADLQKELGLSEDQIKKIKDLQTKQQAANTAIFEKMQSGEIERDQIQPLMQKNTKVLNDEIGKVLTEDQKKKFKELAGKPFVKKADGN